MNRLRKYGDRISEKKEKTRDGHQTNDRCTSKNYLLIRNFPHLILYISDAAFRARW